MCNGGSVIERVEALRNTLIDKIERTDHAPGESDHKSGEICGVAWCLTMIDKLFEDELCGKCNNNSCECGDVTDYDELYCHAMECIDEALVAFVAILTSHEGEFETAFIQKKIHQLTNIYTE